MRFERTNRQKSAKRMNNAVTMPFVTVMAALVLMYLTPVHDLLVAGSEERVLFAFAVSGGDSFEIRYHIEEYGVDVANTMEKQGNGIAMQEILITGNPDYVPDTADMPGVVLTRTPDGCIITGVDKHYDRIDLTVRRDLGYTLVYGDNTFTLADYAGESAVVTMYFKKASLMEVMRHRQLNRRR